MRDTDTAERIAERFHEAYERLASQYGYSTRKESAVPWPEVPEANRMLMVAVVNELGLPRLVEAAERTEAQTEAEISTRVYHYEDRIAELESQVEAAKDFSYASHRRRAVAAEAERDAARQACEKAIRERRSLEQKEDDWHTAYEHAQAERAAVLQRAAELETALRGIELWPYDVGHDAENDLRKVRDVARAALAGPATKEQP